MNIKHQIETLLKYKMVLVHRYILRAFIMECEDRGINIHGGAIAPNGQFFYID